MNDTPKNLLAIKLFAWLTISISTFFLVFRCIEFLDLRELMTTQQQLRVESGLDPAEEYELKWVIGKFLRAAALKIAFIVSSIGLLKKMNWAGISLSILLLIQIAINVAGLVSLRDIPKEIGPIPNLVLKHIIPPVSMIIIFIGGLVLLNYRLIRKKLSTHANNR